MLLKSHLLCYFNIIKYVFSHKDYWMCFLQKQKTPLNKWSLLSLILQIGLYYLLIYINWIYDYFSSCFSTEADASSILGASVSVFSSVFTLSLLEEDSRSCLRCSSLFACASCSRFFKGFSNFYLLYPSTCLCPL